MTGQALFAAILVAVTVAAFVGTFVSARKGDMFTAWSLGIVGVCFGFAAWLAVTS